MALTDHPDEIEAYLTDEASNKIARSLIGEMTFKTVGFSVGRGGYNPADPVHILPVDTSVTQLADQVFPDVTGSQPIIAIDEVAISTRVFNCRLPATSVTGNADYALGEIGLWAEVLYSNDPSEVGQVFLYAIGHFPIMSKTRRAAFLLRVVVNY